MKVKDLLAALDGADPEAEVILQKDAEGNGYSPLEEVDLNAVYVADSTWSGDLYSMDWTAADACMTDEEWAAIQAKPCCVCFK